MKQKHLIEFQTTNGIVINASQNTFLLFIDETGGESLADPNFPIFGFGAVGLPTQLYSSNIIKPWEYLKEKEFGGKDKPLHASDVMNPSKQQMEILGSFFRGCAFCRVAAILSNKTVLANKIDTYNVLTRAFCNRILDVLKVSVCDQLFMIFEHSQRTNTLNMDYFSRYKFNSINEKGESKEVPTQKFIMHKNEMEPGLEVADFVAHTAGTSVYSRLKGRRSNDNDRQDFLAVFKSGDRRLSSFMEITKVKDVTQ